MKTNNRHSVIHITPMAAEHLPADQSGREIWLRMANRFVKEIKKCGFLRC